MSQENVDLVCRLFDQLASRLAVDQALERLSEEALAEFYDPEVRWMPAAQSLLAVDAYHGYDGLRRFWTEFLSAWEEFSLKALDLVDVDDQVAVVMRLTGRLRNVDFDEIWSSLLTLRTGRVVEVRGFTSPEAALQAATTAEQDDGAS